MKELTVPTLMAGLAGDASGRTIFHRPAAPRICIRHHTTGYSIHVSREWDCWEFFATGDAAVAPAPAAPESLDGDEALALARGAAFAQIVQRLLPVDDEAEQLVDAAIARQQSRGDRRPLTRK